jgi:hypothetical protein
MAHCYGSLPGEDQPVEDVGSNTNKLVFDDIGIERYSGMPRMSNIPVDVRPVPDRAGGTRRMAATRRG